jgi:hypothetical protein
MNDQQIENEVTAKGLTAPRITKDQIDALMARVLYSAVGPAGTTSTFVHAFLDGKFLLATGHSACVSPENFDAEIGYNIAKEDAENAARKRLWELEGYALYKLLNAQAEATPQEQLIAGVTIDYIERVARMAHMVNRAYCAALGDLSVPVWEDAPQWQKDSIIAGVKLHLESELTPEQSHESWYEHKLNDGWIFGPVKDPVKKEHPCMVAYSDLPIEQRVKDHLFRAVVKSYL